MNRHKGNTLLVRDADRFGRQIKVANKAKNEKNKEEKWQAGRKSVWRVLGKGEEHVKGKGMRELLSVPGKPSR